MSDNVLDFGELTGKTTDPDKLLENAKGRGIKDLLILGLDEDCNLLLGGNMTIAESNLLIDQAKDLIIASSYADSD